FCSSRRRHTRSKRDWSSDVCSSDLSLVSNEDALLETRDVYFEEVGWVKTPIYIRNNMGKNMFVQGPAIIEEKQTSTLLYPNQTRSEERRVGKDYKDREETEEYNTKN